MNLAILLFNVIGSAATGYCAYLVFKRFWPDEKLLALCCGAVFLHFIAGTWL